MILFILLWLFLMGVVLFIYTIVWLFNPEKRQGVLQLYSFIFRWIGGTILKTILLFAIVYGFAWFVIFLLHTFCPLNPDSS